jgi:undecaprenyl-diphosphatase
MDLYLFLKAVILGLVEGATEFIPVSSTGHLILFQDWLNFEGKKEFAFAIFIQLGAILAVVWVYREKICTCCAPGGRRSPSG